MRPPVPGTLAIHEKTEQQIESGRQVNGDFVQNSPVRTTLADLKRGQSRFDIFCAPCHSKIGDGQGVLIKRGYVPPPTFHSDWLRQVEDGYIYDVISNGIRNMPGYRHQIAVRDRWLITNYTRALQKSQNANIQDVPQEKRTRLP